MGITQTLKNKTMKASPEPNHSLRRNRLDAIGYKIRTSSVPDGGGKIVADFRFEHTAGGWEQFREKLAAFAGVAVAVETKSGTVVEHLQEIARCIFPLHPQSQGYNVASAKCPAATKPIMWMLRAWRMRCGWMEPTGSNRFRRSR